MRNQQDSSITEVPYSLFKIAQNYANSGISIDPASIEHNGILDSVCPKQLAIWKDAVYGTGLFAQSTLIDALMCFADRGYRMEASEGEEFGGTPCVVSGEMGESSVEFAHIKSKQIVAEFERILFWEDPVVGAKHRQGYTFPTLICDFPLTHEQTADFNRSILRSMLKTLRLSPDWRVTLYRNDTSRPAAWGQELQWETGSLGKTMRLVLNVWDELSRYTGTQVAKYLLTRGYKIVPDPAKAKAAVPATAENTSPAAMQAV